MLVDAGRAGAAAGTVGTETAIGLASAGVTSAGTAAAGGGNGRAASEDLIARAAREAVSAEREMVRVEADDAAPSDSDGAGSCWTTGLDWVTTRKVDAAGASTAGGGGAIAGMSGWGAASCAIAMGEPNANAAAIAAPAQNELGGVFCIAQSTSGYLSDCEDEKAAGRSNSSDETSLESMFEMIMAKNDFSHSVAVAAMSFCSSSGPAKEALHHIANSVRSQTSIDLHRLVDSVARRPL